MSIFTRKSLDILEFDAILENISQYSSTSYGIEKCHALAPDRSDQELDLTFDRIECIRGLLIREDSFSFAGVRNVDSALEKAEIPGSFIEPSELLDIRQLSKAATNLDNFITRRLPELSSLVELTEYLASLPQLEKNIENKIDPNDAEIKNTASTKLQKVRKDISSQKTKARNSLNRILADYSKKGWLQSDQPTISEGRPVLAVQNTHIGKIRGIVQGVSATGNTSFIEPAEMVEFSNRIFRLEEEEKAEVRRILAELTKEVRLHLDEIRSNIDVIGELDSLQSRAIYAEKVNGFRPGIKSTELNLVEARHPILLSRKGFDNTVPLSLSLGAESNVLVITGPNAGGKTVSLKTIGLITSLVYSGIIPPCGEGTSVPPIDSWHVVIGDDQSIEGDLSTFSGHISKLNDVITDKSPVKLVLIDEIASGTDPDEGAAIAMAFLEKAVEMSWWAVVTTHIGTLKAFAHRVNGIRNGSMQFDTESLSPSYRFMPDLPGSSYALEIAERVGLPEDVLSKARGHLGDERKRLEDLIEELSQRLSETEKQKRSLNIQQSQTSGLEKLLQERLEILNDEKKHLSEKLSKQAEEVLKDANRAVEKAVKTIRENQASKEAIKKAHQIVDEQKAAVKSIQRNMISGKKKPGKKAGKDIPKVYETSIQADVTNIKLEIGNTVKLENGEKGKISALKKNKVQVMVGSIKLWIDKEKVTPIVQQESKKPGKVRLSIGYEEDLSPVPTELKLIGKRYNEAEDLLHKYLGQLSISGTSRARIVHGKGSGTLSRLVHEVVESHPDVSSYRYGKPEEGGYGVTIIQMED